MKLLDYYNEHLSHQSDADSMSIENKWNIWSHISNNVQMSHQMLNKSSMDHNLFLF